MTSTDLLSFEIWDDDERDDNISNRQMSGEEKLIMALIERACIDYYNEGHGIKGSLSDDARKWFLRKDKKPFSFLWCCDMLEISQKKGREIGKFRQFIMLNRKNGMAKFVRK